MKITLYDPPEVWLDLLPFTYTRPISEIRVGGLTIREKWLQYFNTEINNQSESYLSSIFPYRDNSVNIWSNILPDKALAKAIENLEPGTVLVDSAEKPLAFHKKNDQSIDSYKDNETNHTKYEDEVFRINNLWDIFQYNGMEIGKDYDLVTKGRNQTSLQDPFTKIYSPDNVFIEEGAKVMASILNAEEGPIYIGKNCHIQEGSIIQGPFYLGDNSVVNMGAKIRKNNSTGPHTKIGGELSNSIIFGYSNKAHDGFLGNSVVGEWCNIGADTNTSNLKNNYGEVKIWNYRQNRFVGTGSQFCGLMMGDHSKCAINTMFNTGTVVGVAANIFGSGFPRTSVPSFSWGGSSGYKTFQFDKAIEASEAMMDRRDCKLSVEEKSVLEHVFNISQKYRIWETRVNEV